MFHFHNLFACSYIIQVILAYLVLVEKHDEHEHEECFPVFLTVVSFPQSTSGHWALQCERKKKEKDEEIGGDCEWGGGCERVSLSERSLSISQQAH